MKMNYAQQYLLHSRITHGFVIFGLLFQNKLSLENR